jgi:diacylglycerol kinase family enzyme
LWPRLSDALARRGFAFEVAETRGPGHARILADEAVRAGVPLVVAVGGDGTLNEVVNGVSPLRESHPAVVGAVMTGRGRDACRNLGLPRDPARAVERLVDGRVVPRDLALAVWPGGRRFVVSAVGVGFDARVVERAGTRGGRLRYLAAVVACLRDYQALPVVVDGPAGESWTGAAASVIVCNGSRLGGGMRIAPAARVDDGLLDVVVLGALGRAELALWLPTVFWGGHLANRQVRSWRAPVFRVSMVGAPSVQLDGELGAGLPLEISAQPGALRLRV